ncbi:anaerobic ribonucleoside-triphosphate reductase activating protein [Achromobacter sp. F4_2707]|uniref:anaerobic ribonucleoside-triphosphate reductase activating protein n=1 Tax=Achromobacter sp. F4_2707 TaxID=3114286 RepID=UPI0039C6437A
MHAAVALSQAAARPESAGLSAETVALLPPITLKVGGITPFSATDFPGKLCAVLFVQGCPWRCGYCHNPHLQARTAESPISWDDISAFLRRRTGLIDAVVFSGGEPTMDSGLETAMLEAREHSFLVGLHTGGIYPDRLRKVLPLVDWVGLDIKATGAGYEAVTQVRNSGAPAFESLRAVLQTGVSYEVRTTIHPRLHDEDEIRTLARQLARSGVTHYALQVFRPTGCQDDALNHTRFHDYPGEALLAELHALFPHFILRKEGGG